MNSRLSLWSLGIHLALWYCHLPAEAQVKKVRPSLVVEPRSLVVDINSDVTFNCKWTGNPPRTLTWTKKGNNMVLSNNNKLHLKSISQLDAGQYVCKAMVPRIPRLVEKEVSLTVNGPPIVSGDPIQYAVTGETGEVKCYVAGTPPPDKIVWTWRDDALTERYTVEQSKVHSWGGAVLSTLIINNVVESDFESPFNCTARNAFGPSTMTITLEETERGSTSHLDLTELIGVPLPPSVSFITGYEGFPAYSFGPDANIGRLTKTFVPDPFFRDFAVIVTIKPTTTRGGVLFAITDAFQKIVYLGLALTPVEDQTQRIILYYSEQGSSRSQQVASFKVPDMSNKWNRFTLTVQDDEVRLYTDCEEYHSMEFQRSPNRLRFEASSGIFVGNAGGTGLERFVGSIQQLVLKPDPRAAEEQCEEDDPYASGYGSGDDSLDDRETVDEVKKRVDEKEFTSSWPDDSLSTPVSAPPTQSPHEDEEDAYSGDVVPTEEASSSQGIILTAETDPSHTENRDQGERSRSKGERGDSGPPGPPGSPGPPGPSVPSRGGSAEAGQPGPRGPPGPKGDTGPQGKDAQPGIRGKDGDAGEQGPQGFPGLGGEPGLKGDKGDSGVGVAGPPGPPGPPGQPSAPRHPDGVDVYGSGFGDFDSDAEVVIGPPGPPGPPGKPGPPGTSKPFGPTEGLFPGPPGAPGTPGKDGKDGELGKPGSPVFDQWFSGSGSGFDSEFDPGEGPPGVDGGVGQAGDKGDKGDVGLAGKPGPKGEMGDPGLPGPIGPEGPEGPVGLHGPPGPPGPPGPSGLGFAMEMEDLEGSGRLGAFGMPGPEGPQGPPGLPGLPGPKGADGTPSVGEKGERGDPGSEGNPGVAGLPGLRGETGETGSLGTKGERGADGLSVTGPPGPPGPPGPIISLQDLLLNDTDGTFNFTDTQGPPGPMGPEGLPGRAGFPGPRGPKGDPGPPATECPAGLKGEKGEPMVAIAADGSLMTGLRGPQGPKGFKGERGFPGPVGLMGPIGPHGPKGEFGFPGRPGRPGMVGKKGDKGDTVGQPGAPGPPGPPGRPGPLNCPKGINGSTDSTQVGSDCRGRTRAKGEKGEAGFPGQPGSMDSWLPERAVGDKGDTGYRGEKGQKGEAGLQGSPGLPGRSGLVGPKGEAVVGSQGQPGNPGLPGHPGYGRPGPQGPQGPPGAPGPPPLFGSAVAIPGPPGPPGLPGSPGLGNPVTTYKTVEALFHHMHRSAEGTMAYVSEKSELYIRVREGWRKVQLGELISLPVDSPSPVSHVLSRPGEISYSDLITQGQVYLPGYNILAHTIHTGPGLHMVALNAPFSGDMRGIHGADYQCYQQARAMGLVTTYRAFLSSPLQDLATIVKKGDRFNMPILNLKGEVLFNNWMSIFSGNGGVFQPSIPIYSFDGRNVITDPSWPQKMVWHGSSAVGIRLTSNFCEAWRAGHMAVTGQASLLHSGRLLGQHTRSCSNHFIVLCIENSYVQDAYRN